jgi:tetratricopeptide (TPR) repeat protein
MSTKKKYLIDKQQELFPFIMGQDSIDSYVDAQKSLKEWKEVQRGWLSSANVNLQLLQYAKALKEDENFAEIYIRQCTNQANEALETCSSKLTEIGSYIATLEEAIRLFNEAIISYPSYRQIAQNKI